MKLIHKLLASSLLAISVGAGSLAVQAQPAHGAPAAANHERSPEQMRERMQKRQQALHAKLRLDGNQEAAWNTYIARMRPAEMHRRPDRAEMEKLNVPERMEKRLVFMKQAEKRMTDRLAATREFYAVLSPEQQKIFNEEFMSRSGPRHHGGHYR